MNPKPDLYDAAADAVADVARLAAQQDDPKRNLLGVTSDQLDRAKRRLAELLRSVSVVIAVFAAGAAMADEQTRFFGPDGRTIGTATTDSAGSTRFRDARGRTTGMSTTIGGTTTFYDERGRVVGRATGPRK
jgi:hypothetical protein